MLINVSRPKKEQYYETGAPSVVACPVLQTFNLFEARSRAMPLEIANLSDDELDKLRDLISLADSVEVGPEMRALVEQRWPWLLPKFVPSEQPQ